MESPNKFNDNKLAALFSKRPHLVILGAGATVDTILDGDKNGNKSSTMAGFIDKLGMRDIISSVHLRTKSDNLEDIYSELYEREDCNDVRKELEKRIYTYFSRLEIPNEVTKYDLLVASLTSKDCIATFNWDPLLIDAYMRIRNITTDLPEIIFLHGNIKVGYCPECDNFGYYLCNCQNCGQQFRPSKLLYPIRHKNYDADPFIQNQWKIFEDFLSEAVLITIYGYSAPKTDIEAIDKLQRAFTRLSQQRFLDNIQIIEKPDFNPKDISDAWINLSHHVHGHLDLIKSFFDSYLAEFPRRSVEGYIKRNIMGWWGDSNLSFPKERGCNYTFDELAQYIDPLHYVDPFESLGDTSFPR